MADSVSSPDADENARRCHLGPHPCPSCGSQEVHGYRIKGVTFCECRRCGTKGPGNKIVQIEGADRIGRVRAYRQAHGDWNEWADQGGDTP